VTFYTRLLGFELIEQFGRAMAITRRDELTLWLAGRAGRVRVETAAGWPQARPGRLEPFRARSGRSRGAGRSAARE
jgi:catechol 2,3-dioxygenase-like lactoylglutathione lyase family enzyme